MNNSPIVHVRLGSRSCKNVDVYGWAGARVGGRGCLRRASLPLDRQRPECASPVSCYRSGVQRHFSDYNRFDRYGSRVLVGRLRRDSFKLTVS